MIDVLTIGSATVDIFMKSPEFHLQPTQEGVLLCQEYGGKLDIDQFQMTPGGAGTNIAVGLARLGFQTAAVVEIGKDVLGQMIWDELKREHVNTDFVITEKGEQTAVSVLLISGEGGRSALTHRGAASQLEARDIPWNFLSQTRWIHLSNIAGNEEILHLLFSHLTQSPVGLSWNPGRKELDLLIQGKVVVESIRADILFMNSEEWQRCEQIQERLLQAVSIVVITDGKIGGKIFVHGQFEFAYHSKEVPVTQETGAGDAFATGFIAAHLAGFDPVTASKWGVENSTSVIQHMDAKQGLLTKDEMLSRIKDERKIE